jgi:6-phosphogluconolactonase
MKENLHLNRPALAAALAEHVAGLLGEAIAERGSATLVVPGGSASQPLFEQLRERELDWAQVTVVLADERWVPTDHADSNEALVRRELLRGAASAATLVGLKTDGDTPEDGLSACVERVAELPRPLDVVVIGMGEDGHFASLFPGKGPELDPTLWFPCVVTRPVEAPHARMSLSANRLLDARVVLLHVEGDTKWDVLKFAEQAGPANEVPIRLVTGQDAVPVELWWAP